MTAAGALDGLLDLVFPRRCVQCKASGAWLCEPCAGGLVPLPRARCARCGAPVRWAPTRPRAGGRSAAGRRPCRECAGRDLSFAAADAAFVYSGPARALVAACKFRAYRSLAGEMVALAAPAFAAAAAETAGAAGLAAGGGGAAGGSAAVVTWVPGHRGHTLERGFNQAELLARGLAREAGLTAAPLLSRTRHGARQSGLGRAARAANVSGAFALREGSNGVVRMFKRVIIVDDVYTTGETLNRCSEVLALAGFRPHVFTFARTVRATAVPASPGNAAPKERCS